MPTTRLQPAALIVAIAALGLASPVAACAQAVAPAAAPASSPTPSGAVAGQTTAQPTANDLADMSPAAAAYAKSAIQAPDPRQPPTSKPGALTLAQVIDLARTKNQTLLAAELNLRAVRAQELQAATRQNPTLGVAGTTITLPNDGSEGNPPSYAFQVSRLFERGNKRGLRLEDARATTRQTAAQLEDSARQTVLQVKTAFTHMLIAKEASQISNASLKDFQHEVEIANDRYKAGDLAKLDFERLDLQLGSYESDEANDIINLRQAADQLQTLMGVETPSSDFDITGDIVPPNVTETQADLVQLALAKRPDYAATRFAIDAAEANARLAIANGTADPTLEGEYDRSGNFNSAGFNFSIPLRLFDRNQGNKATARYQADASRFTATAARFQVISDVDQAWVSYTQSKRLSDRFGSHYLDESRDVLSIAQYAFEHGGIALIDYLDALRDARSSTSDALNAYQNTWLAIHQLAAAAATELAP